MQLLLLVLIYVAITCVIGFVLTKRSRSSGEFMVAKNQLSLGMLVVLLFGEIIAASSTTGSAQGGYDQGISAIWIFAGRGLGALLFVVVLARFFTEAGKAGVMSIPEAFGWRFDGKTRILVTIVILIPLMLMCSTQVKACAALLSQMLEVDVVPLVVAIGVLFGVLACTGLKGIANMNLFHSAVIFFGVLVVTVACVNFVGGPGSLFERVPAEYRDFLYPSAAKIGGDFFSAVLAFAVAVIPANACFSSTDIGKNGKGLCIAGSLTIVYAFFPVLIGLSAAIALPGADSNSIIYAMPSFVSPWLGTLIAVAILAIVLSSAPFLFLSASTILVRDVFVPVMGNAKTDAWQLRLSKLLVIPVTVAAILFALNTDSIFSQIIGAAHIKATAAIVLIAGVYWKRLTNHAAFSALLVSGVLSIVWFFSGDVFGMQIEAFWPALAISVFLMVVVTLLDRKHQFEDFERYHAQWKGEAKPQA